MNDSNPPIPVIRKPRRWSLVWVVPVVTLVLSGWLVLRELRQSGPTIEISFADGTGIEPDRTRVMHKGVTVGVVKQVTLDKSLQKVIARVELDRAAAPLARQETKFWIVRPEVSLRGITGLGTILSGPTIAVLPGGGGERKSFEGLVDAPRDPQKPARTFILRAADVRSLTENSPVYYRGLEAGYIEDLQLSPDASTVLVRVRIFEPYFALVRSRTRFWNASGFDMKLGLSGAKIETESLQSILAGGVSFATPPDPGPEAIEGTEFDLAANAADEWLTWRPSLR
jgi:paraquat-inducible protein B